VEREKKMRENPDVDGGTSSGGQRKLHSGIPEAEDGLLASVC